MLRENKPPARVTVGVFDSFHVAVCTSEYAQTRIFCLKDLPITLSFHVTCIVQSNFESFAIEL